MPSIPHSRPTIDSDDIGAVCNVLESSMIAESDLCELFEFRFAQYLGTPGAVAVSSGTLALQIALLALGVSPGDKVLVPTYMSRAPLDACSAIRCQPILLDSGRHYNLDIEDVRKVMDSRVKAVIVPHILGITADIGSIKGLGVPVVEDCAHSIGGVARGRKLGTFGDMSIVSFHATKIMTTGEGGIVSSCNANLVEKARNIKLNLNSEFHPRLLFPMTDMQAALGISQLERLDLFIEKRREIANFYFSKLKGLRCRLPYALKDKSVFFRFPIKVDKGLQDCIDGFSRYDVTVRKPVAVLLHQLLGIPSRDFPIAEKLWEKALGLPIYPSLTEETLRTIIHAAREVLC